MKSLGRGAVGRLRALGGDLGPGDVVADRYELREPLGEGGMGLVFAAWDRTTEREVAVKLLAARDESALARFEREVRAAAATRHPAIVRALDHGVHDGRPYLVMDLRRGPTLAARLTRGPLSVDEAIAMGARLADALAALHAARVVHRDVKPGNVILTGGQARDAELLDLGLARELGTDAPVLTRGDALIGTPGYAAPEQVRGGEPAGESADVFALGCVLFECLTGTPAFRGDGTEDLLARTLAFSPPLVRTLRPEVPIALEATIEEMLAKDPRARPTAATVHGELSRLAESLPAPGEAFVQEGELVAPGLKSGQIIGGKYRIERRIGEGGMGVVVAARQLELGRRVALKWMRRGDRTDEARFVREAQAASRLESEHVARVLDVGRTEDGTPYTVMELLRGEDFAAKLARTGPWPVPEAVDALLEAMEAIAEAHALGIVHRDLKPSNLFWAEARDGRHRVKVLDFGISKVTRGGDAASATASNDTRLASMSMTGAGEVIGSVWYMSPEQLQATKDVDARTDVWSLGVVLYELVTGARPFEGDGAAAVGARIAAADPRPSAAVGTPMPRDLEAVVVRALAKDPDARYADVRSFADALAPFGSAAARASATRIARLLPARAASDAHGGSEAPRRRPLVLVAAAISIACGIAAVVLLRGTRLAADGAPPSDVASSRAVTSAPIASAAAESAKDRPAESPLTAPTTVPREPASAAPSAAAPPSPVLSAALKPMHRTASPVLPAPSASARTRAPVTRDLDLHDPALEGR